MKLPYDEELKRLVKDFADLVTPMVETVDRYGLKSRFLRNRNKLFTFLVHDGVPWNNNNAEHAIKAFAMLRNVIGGLTSERGIWEYLIMLSISETFKYRELNFLYFLRSGEKDIRACAASKQRRRSGQYPSCHAQ